jgi:hypothetical protein
VRNPNHACSSGSPDSAGSNAPKPHEHALSLQSDCFLLNALSTPIATLEQVSDVKIVDPTVVTIACFCEAATLGI